MHPTDRTETFPPRLPIQLFARIKYSPSFVRFTPACYSSDFPTGTMRAFAGLTNSPRHVGIVGQVHGADAAGRGPLGCAYLSCALCSLSMYCVAA
jgi:hypothetical protein